MKSELREHAAFLSQLVKKSDEYQNLKNAQNVVQNDSEALEIMLDYQALGMQANQKMMQGKSLSQQEIRALNEKELLIKGNEKLNQWSTRQAIFSKMMEDVLKIIQQGLAGDDTFIDKSGRLNIYHQ